MAYGLPPPSPDEAPLGTGAKPMQASARQANLQAKMQQMQQMQAQKMRQAQAQRGAGGPPAMPDPATRAQMKADMVARFPNGPPRGAGIFGGAPQMGRPPVNVPGAKAPAPYRGGAFGMAPPRPAGGGAFGAMTKAPLSTGQASPFAGMAGGMDRFAGTRGDR
jgi:hypothetical protein